MIRGIGIDSVEIDRFADWRTFSDEKLRKIFSDNEIAYCRQVPIKSAERFAVRYAVREAFFKAVSAMSLKKHRPFLTACKLVDICRDDRGACTLKVDWREIIQEGSAANFHVHLSMTHDKVHAITVVIIEEIE